VRFLDSLRGCLARKRSITDVVTEIALIAHHITDIAMDVGITVTDIIMVANLEVIKAAEDLIDYDKRTNARSDIPRREVGGRSESNLWSS